MDIKQHVEQLTKDLMDKGLIVEAGWVGFKLMTLPAEASPIQIEEMRNSFFAGAMHVFSSIISGVEQNDSEETTLQEVTRMDNLNKELNAFGQAFCKKHRMEGLLAMMEKPGVPN